MALLYNRFENGCFMADSQTVLDIRDDLGATMNECREVTEKYRTGRSAYLRIGQLFMRLFAGKIKSHYALIGMAFVAGGYPLLSKGEVRWQNK